MIGEPWLYAALTALGALNLLAGVYAARRATRMTGPREAEGDEVAAGGSEVADPDVEADGDVVDCPQCDARNERGYRYCRVCVTELPASDVPRDTSPPARGNNVL